MILDHRHHLSTTRTAGSHSRGDRRSRLDEVLEVVCRELQRQPGGFGCSGDVCELEGAPALPDGVAEGSSVVRVGKK